ncbi:MAG: hypothetical protein Q7R70_03850 [Candidatus Diapherotrites archaeon]|nr:hypothetical protein [Candidatus Diapherotrites archaeon]
MPASIMPKRTPLAARKAPRANAKIIAINEANAHSLLRSFLPKPETAAHKFHNAAELEARRIASFNSKTRAALKFVKQGYSAKDLKLQISNRKVSAAEVLLMQGFGVRALNVLKFPEAEVNSAVKSLVQRGYSEAVLEKRFGIPKSLLDKLKI